MTAKSIVQVSVDPEGNFKAFYDLFKEYQSQLAAMPEDWQATSDAIGDAGSQMEEFSKASDASRDFLLIAATQSEIISKEIKKASASNVAFLHSINKNVVAQRQFADESERGHKALEKMKKSADGVAHSVFGIGKFLMKLSALGVGFAGLSGLLSTIGLKDLASSSVDTQRSARGLGMTPGQLTAFGQDFSRYVDPGSLESIAGAQGSFQGRAWLSRASGININQLAGMDPGELAGKLALRAHDWWTNTPASMRTQEVYQSTGLAQSGISFEAARREGFTPRSELERAASQYQQDQRRFNVSDQSTDTWYNFLRQIKDAGNTIETDLKNKLVALAPDLQKFVSVLGKDAMKLIDDILTPRNLQVLEDAIKGFTTYLGSSQFQQDMKDFAGLVGVVVGAMRKAAKFLGIDPNPNPSPAEAIPVNPGLDPDEVQRETHGKVTGFGGISTSDKALGYARHFLNMPSDARQKLAALDVQNNLPPGTLEAIWKQESGEGKSLVGPVTKTGDQAIGDFQFTSSSWKEWGKGGDRFSFTDESAAAGRYMSSLTKRYGGDVKKALAAYNWGPGNLDKDIAKRGAGWEAGLPAETRNYINKITAMMARNSAQTVTVKVENNTSARVSVQTNAAAIQ